MGSVALANDIRFEYAYFADASDLSKYLRIYDPILLQFSCHSSWSALALFEKDLVAKDLVQFIGQWVASGKG